MTIRWSMIILVEQTHEIQSLTKELESFKCVSPDKFVTGCIIVKLPPTWTDFATSLKHKRKEFNIPDLIGFLDVEENVRVKNTHEKGVIRTSSVNVVGTLHTGYPYIQASS
jgi:hypothetical protein